MQKFNLRFPKIRIGLCVILHLGLLTQPLSSSAATPPVLDTRVQALSTIYVESVTATAGMQFPSLHSDAKQLLTKAFRNQLKEADRLQSDPTVHALRLIGVILSYREATLDVQGTLYDDEKSLIYSRVKRHIEPDGNWDEAIDLIAEQLLDELIGKLRDMQQPGYSRYYEPNDCYANSRCSDPYYVSWGWWRLSPLRDAHHGPINHARKDPGKSDLRHAEPRDAKPHWDAGNPGEPEHKEHHRTLETPNIDTRPHSEEAHSSPEAGHIYPSPEVTGGPRHEPLPAPLKQPTTTPGTDTTLTQPNTARPSEKPHHHGDLALEAKPETLPTVSTPTLTDTRHDSEHHHREPAESTHDTKVEPSSHETHRNAAAQTRELTPNTAAAASSSTGAAPAAVVAPAQNTMPVPAATPGYSSPSPGNSSFGNTNAATSPTPSVTPSPVAAPSYSTPSSENSSFGSSSSTSSVASPAPSVTSSPVAAPSYSTPSSGNSSFGSSSSTSSVASPTPSVTSSPVTAPSYSAPSSESSSFGSSSNSSASSPTPSVTPSYSAPSSVSSPSSSSTNSSSPTPPPTPPSPSKSEEKHHDKPDATH